MFLGTARASIVPSDNQQGGKTSAERKAAFRERQKALGRRQRNYWLTDDEAAAVAALIERLRDQGEP